MLKTGVKLSFMAAAFFMVMFCDLSIGRVFAQKCEQTTDEQIVEYMYTKMKANSTLASQVMHINVISTNRVIRFQGWVKDEASYKKLESIGLENSCIVMINPSVKDLLREEPTEEMRLAMCAGGTKPCGDICIPENDACNIGIFGKH